jgi:hypothetical protein
VLYRFGREASSQERVLLAFELADWPESVENPFAENGKEGAEQLRQTVKDLNRRVKTWGLRFWTDGWGRVLWALIKS